MTGNTGKTRVGKTLALPAGLELGHYRLLSKLGQGGFGITYLAQHVQTGEQVVVKENLPTFYASRSEVTLQVHPLDDEETVENYAHTLRRFVDEARLLARLNHPNIVRVTEAFEALGTAYYVMPYIQGQELHKAAPAVVTEEWLRPILKTLLSALEYLHGKNLLHRDLKPGNILLTADGTPMLIDFGTARALQTERSATMVGTPGYTPIEQVTTHGKCGAWTDLYALGATCYRLITGERPPDSVDLVADETLYVPLAHRGELSQRFSLSMLQSIDTAMAVRAVNRWQNAREWLSALELPAVPSLPAMPQPEPATEAGSKRPIIYIIVALLLLIPAAYGIYTYLQAAEEEKLAAAMALQEREAAERRARIAEAAALEQQKLAAAERKAREEAERKAREEAERIAREEAERKAREEAERKAREESERKAREEAEKKAQRKAAVTSPQAMQEWVAFHKRTSPLNDLSYMTEYFAPQVTNLKTGQVMSLAEKMQEDRAYVSRWPERRFDVIDFKITGNIIEIRAVYNCSDLNGKTASGFCKTTYRISDEGKIDGIADDSSSSVLPDFSGGVGFGSSGGASFELTDELARSLVQKHLQNYSSNDLSSFSERYEAYATNLADGTRHSREQLVQTEREYISRWVYRKMELVDYAFRGNRLEIRTRFTCTNTKGKTVHGYCKTTYCYSVNGRIEAFADDSSTSQLPSYSSNVGYPQGL